MWRELKSLTDNKPNNHTSNITDNSRALVSQRQRANVLMNMHKSVSSLNLTKEDRGVKRIINRTLCTLEVTNGTWNGFTISEARASLSHLNPSNAACPDKINPRLPRHLAQGGFVPAIAFQHILGVDVNSTMQAGR